ncbi:MAG TPA: outer membrane beta-barrel protein [Candidatus Sulfotelmatobacter sp.]
MAGKFVLIAISLLTFATVAAAQVPHANVFFGYSYYHTDLSSIDSANTNGWEASVEGKVIPFLGFVADVDTHYGSQNFPAACPVNNGTISCYTLNASFTEHNFLFGPRVSVSVSKFRPFAEALFGGAHISLNNSEGSDTSFSTAVGGGLDYKIIPLIAWRFQGDYVQTRFFDATQNNVRISTGLVLRF